MSNELVEVKVNPKELRSIKNLLYKIEDLEELKSAYTHVRNEYIKQHGECMIPVLDRAECRALGLSPANRLSSLLAMYKELSKNDTK